MEGHLARVLLSFLIVIVIAILRVPSHEAQQQVSLQELLFMLFIVVVIMLHSFDYDYDYDI
jgi:hypothetical protein